VSKIPANNLGASNQAANKFFEPRQIEIFAEPQGFLELRFAGQAANFATFIFPTRSHCLRFDSYNSGVILALAGLARSLSLSHTARVIQLFKADGICRRRAPHPPRHPPLVYKWGWLAAG
jgi:hypothetical protein